jgi:hypothetical protein
MINSNKQESKNSQFFEVFNKLNSLTIREKENLLKSLTAGESKSHFCNKFISGSHRQKDIAISIWNWLGKDYSNDLNKSLIWFTTKPSIGIRVDLNSGNAEVVPTRSKTVRVKDQIIFNYSEDFDSPYLYLELFQNKKEKVDNLSETLFSKKRFIESLDDSNYKVTQLQELLYWAYLSFNGYSSKFLKIMVSIFLENQKQVVNDPKNNFDKSVKDHYKLLIAIDALAFYSQQINNFDESKLSLFKKLWLKKERKRLLNHGYLSKGKWITSSVTKEGMGFIFS